MICSPRTSTGRLRGPARAWPWLLAALIALPAAFADSPDENPARPPEPPPDRGPGWREVATKLPVFPSAATLVPLPADAVGSGYTYFIDVNSISVDKDGVARYTVVIVSPSGATSIFHEGIRCETKKTKPYAYGTRAGEFEVVASPRWTDLYAEGALAYRNLLADRYLCDEEGWAVDTDTVLERVVAFDPRRPSAVPKPNDDSDR